MVVAVYIEQLTGVLSPATVKQHLAALRMLIPARAGNTGSRRPAWTTTYVRFIPARAGNTPPWPASRPSYEVRFIPARAGNTSGRSRDPVVEVRFIPARAGNTLPTG